MVDSRQAPEWFPNPSNLRVGVAAESFQNSVTGRCQTGGAFGGLFRGAPVVTRQLERSVQTWNPDRSTHTWSIAHSVTPLVVEKQDASNTVLTLTSDVLFEFGKADIGPVATTVIAAELDATTAGSAGSLGGYTDSIGDSASNPEGRQQNRRVEIRYAR